VQHLPGFIGKADEMRKKGVDEIFCLSVNDGWVMDAWGKDRAAIGKVTLIADGSGEFTRAMGLELDATGAGLGIRSQRYAAIVEDGVIRHLAVEKPMKFEVSSAEAVLQAL
jgi:peroxiredoxin